MKQTMKYLNMAALVAAGAIMMGCSKAEENLLPEDQSNNKTVTLTTTVGFDEEAETRALNIDYVNKLAVKTFAAGETMAIVYKNNSGQTVKTVSAALPTGDYGNSATFTFELEDPDKTQNVMYIYPAAMAKAAIATDATIDAANAVDFTNLDAQNGTLATLSTSLDLATYSAAWDGTSLPAGTLANQLAVCALTLKNSDGSSTITSGLTQVTVNDGSNTYTVTPTGSNFGEATIYVAIRPVTAALQYTATDGTSNYTKTATSREYAAGNFFNLGLRMVPAITYTAPTLRTGLTFNGNRDDPAGSAQALVDAGSVTNGTMYYSTNGTDWSTSVPTQTDAGDYTVYYKVEPDEGYTGRVASTRLGSATMAKADGWCSLSPSYGTGFGPYHYENSGCDVKVTHHGGTLSFKKKGSNSVHVKYRVDGPNWVRIYKFGNYMDYGTGIIVTVTSGETTNYNAASANFTTGY